MSNKTQLQTNNTKYASLIETLRGKAAGGSGEDVTEETNAYTTKLASLETAITALETELEGKASSGSGGGVETCTVTFINCSNLHLTFSYIKDNGELVSTIFNGHLKDHDTYNILKTFIIINDYRGWSLSMNTVTVTGTSDLYIASEAQGSLFIIDLTNVNNEITIEYVG